MAKNSFSSSACLATALLIAGCSHQPTAPAAGESQAQGGQAPTAAFHPDNPDDIIALGKRLSQDRLSLFSVTKGKYTFYVGGMLSASYETATEILRISSLTPEDKVAQVCEYSPHGVLFVDPKDQAEKDAFVSRCDKLALRLNDYLSR
jgi:hypothetical protein